MSNEVSQKDFDHYANKFQHLLGESFDPPVEQLEIKVFRKDGQKFIITLGKPAGDKLCHLRSTVAS